MLKFNTEHQSFGQPTPEPSPAPSESVSHAPEPAPVVSAPEASSDNSGGLWESVSSDAEATPVNPTPSKPEPASAGPASGGDKPLFELVKPDTPGAEGPSKAEPQKTQAQTLQDEKSREIENKLFAEMMVITADILISIVIQIILKDWSEEAEGKYSLSKKRKKEISDPLFRWMQETGKQQKPGTAFLFLLIGSYVPIFIMAGKDFIKKKRDKKGVKGKGKKALPKQPPTQPQVVDSGKQTFDEQLKELEAKNLKLEGLLKEKGVNPSEVLKKAEETPEIEPNNEPGPGDVDPKTGNKKRKPGSGRKKGSKRNPNTGKIEPPLKIENGWYHYSWGAKAKVK